MITWLAKIPTAIGHALTAFKNAQKLDAQKALLDEQERSRSLALENETLREQVRREASAADVRARLVFEHNVYWLNRADGQREQDPYCPRCWDDEKKLMHLTFMDLRKRDYASCQKCTGGYDLVQRLNAPWDEPLPPRGIMDGF